MASDPSDMWKLCDKPAIRDQSGPSFVWCTLQKKPRNSNINAINMAKIAYCHKYTMRFVAQCRLKTKIMYSLTPVQSFDKIIFVIRTVIRVVITQLEKYFSKRSTRWLEEHPFARQTIRTGSILRKTGRLFRWLAYRLLPRMLWCLVWSFLELQPGFARIFNRGQFDFNACPFESSVWT